MKDNARQDQGSTESLRRSLSRSDIPTRRFDVWRENPTKMQPKCNQKRECDFFNCSLSTACNFGILNRSHFLRLRSYVARPVAESEVYSSTRNGRMLSPLPRAAETKSLVAHGASLGQSEGQTGRLRVCQLFPINLLSELYSENRIKPYKTE
jgi:hypothetical protein